MTVYVPSAPGALASMPAGANPYVNWTNQVTYANQIGSTHAQYATGVNSMNTSSPWYSGPSAITIAAITTYVATAYSPAGTVLRCGIYRIINQQYPFIISYSPYATLLQETGTMDITTTGLKTLNPNLVIPSNTWFTLASVEQGATTNGTRYVAANTSGGASPYGQTNSPGGMFSYQAVCVTMSPVAGALPATLTPTGPINNATDCGLAWQRA